MAVVTDTVADKVNQNELELDELNNASYGDDSAFAKEKNIEDDGDGDDDDDDDVL